MVLVLPSRQWRFLELFLTNFPVLKEIILIHAPLALRGLLAIQFPDIGPEELLRLFRNVNMLTMTKYLSAKSRAL